MGLEELTQGTEYKDEQREGSWRHRSAQRVYRGVGNRGKDYTGDIGRDRGGDWGLDRLLDTAESIPVLNQTSSSFM